MIERVFVEQGLKRVQLDSYLHSQLYRAGYSSAEIVKTPLVTRIIVSVAHPSFAIGRGGQTIKALTDTIEKKFRIENPQIEIREITVPALDARVMADKLKSLVERGYSWRSVAYRILRDVMEAKAQGIELVVAGKLAGKGGRKRHQRIAEGYMKKVGDQVKYVDYAKATAYTKAGAIGIKLSIVRPETVFPDKVRISDSALVKGMQAAEAQHLAEGEAAEKAAEERGEEAAIGESTAAEATEIPAKKKGEGAGKKETTAKPKKEQGEKKAAGVEKTGAEKKENKDAGAGKQKDAEKAKKEGRKEAKKAGA